jgi:hypothetical protein
VNVDGGQYNADLQSKAGQKIIRDTSFLRKNIPFLRKIIVKIAGEAGSRKQEAGSRK